jgi:hypothetical protein
VVARSHTPGVLARAFLTAGVFDVPCLTAEDVLELPALLEEAEPTEEGHTVVHIIQSEPLLMRSNAGALTFPMYHPPSVEPHAKEPVIKGTSGATALFAGSKKRRITVRAPTHTVRVLDCA